MKYFASRVVTGIFAFSLGLLGACAPHVSSVPLGVGPLALAEQEASISAAPETPSVKAKPAPLPAPPSPPPMAASEKDGDTDADEADDSEGEPGAIEGAATADVAAPQFAGLYAGADVAIFRLPGFPDREQLDDKAKVRIEKDSDTALRIALVNSDDGSDLCELKATVQGTAAVLEANQACFSSEGEDAVRGQITSGRAVLDGDQLTLDAEGTLAVTMADQELEGELSYSFTGKRQ